MRELGAVHGDVVVLRVGLGEEDLGGEQGAVGPPGAGRLRLVADDLVDEDRGVGRRADAGAAEVHFLREIDLVVPGDRAEGLAETGVAVGVPGAVQGGEVQVHRDQRRADGRVVAVVHVAGGDDVGIGAQQQVLGAPQLVGFLREPADRVLQVGAAA